MVGLYGTPNSITIHECIFDGTDTIKGGVIYIPNDRFLGLLSKKSVSPSSLVYSPFHVALNPNPQTVN